MPLESCCRGGFQNAHTGPETHSDCSTPARAARPGKESCSRLFVGRNRTRTAGGIKVVLGLSTADSIRSTRNRRFVLGSGCAKSGIGSAQKCKRCAEGRAALSRKRHTPEFPGKIGPGHDYFDGWKLPCDNGGLHCLPLALTFCPSAHRSSWQVGNLPHNCVVGQVSNLPEWIPLRVTEGQCDWPGVLWRHLRSCLKLPYILNHAELAMPVALTANARDLMFDHGPAIGLNLAQVALTVAANGPEI